MIHVDDFKLCYAEGANDEGVVLYFCAKDPEEMTGDDWDNAPAVHNAGAPYIDEESILSFAYLGEYDMADANTLSADEINTQVGVWASLYVEDKIISCNAWDTYCDVLEAISHAKGLALKEGTNENCNS